MKSEMLKTNIFPTDPSKNAYAGSPVVGKGPGSANEKYSSSTSHAAAAAAAAATTPEVTVTASSSKAKAAATTGAAAAAKDEVQILNVTPASKFFNGQGRYCFITLLSRLVQRFFICSQLTTILGFWKRVQYSVHVGLNLNFKVFFLAHFEFETVLHSWFKT